MERGRHVATIANQFIQHARYKLTSKEQKLILYMATLVRPEDSDFETYTVPVTDIEALFKLDEDKKHGSFYERLDQLLDSITDKKITFPTDFVMDGVRLRGHINWVAGAVPKYNEEGILCVEFGFSPQMKPFLLGLKEKFTRFEFLEVVQMKSGFSIRIYQMCKSYYHENIRHGRNVLIIDISEIRQRLGIIDKFTDFRNLRRKVLDVAREEINTKTRLHIEYDFIRQGRNITSIKIIIHEKEDFNPELLPASTGNDKISGNGMHPDLEFMQQRVAALTEAQRRALNILLEFGLNAAFSLDEILPIIKGSELVGYEDFFVTSMVDFFNKKTHAKTPEEKVKAFMGWVNNKRFEEPALYTCLREQVIARKKRLNDLEFSNRERAKYITAAEFRKLLEAEKKQGQSSGVASGTQKNSNKIPPEYKINESEAHTMQLEDAGAASDAENEFDIKLFKKMHPDVYKQIYKERKKSFEPLRSAVNYRQLLENSVKAHCEKWWNDHR